MVAAAWLSAVTTVLFSVEHLPGPLGLDTTTPRFSWKGSGGSASTSTTRGVRQTEYRLQVAAAEAALAAGPYVWDSGSVPSNASHLVAYSGSAALGAGRPYFARVLVSYNAGESSEDAAAPVASAAVRFSIAPTAVGSSYAAKFIGLPAVHHAPSPPGPAPAPGPGPAASLPFNQSSCPWLRKTFTLGAFAPSAGDSALIAVGSVGFHELWVNGEKATDDVLSPSVSDLAKRVLVRTYDIAPLLKPGKNTIGLWLSTGWAGFNSVNPAKTNLFNVSHAPLAMAELSVFQAGHQTMTLLTDASWKASPSDTAHIGAWKNGNFGGDRVDARLSQPGWSVTATDDSAWSAAEVYALPPGIMLASEILEPNRMREVSRRSKRLRLFRVHRYYSWLTGGGAEHRLWLPRRS